MKILFITDTHIGARNSSSVFRNMFKEYYNNTLFPYIIDNEIELVIHTGDFFDDRNKLTLHDLDYIKNDYIPNFEKTGAAMYIIAGNHDVAFKNTNSVNSLSIFKGHDCFKIVDTEVEVLNYDKIKLVLCPWLNSSNMDELLEEVKLQAGPDSILCGHFEIKNTKMYKNSPLSEHGLDQSVFKQYKQVLSGHFHHRSDYGNIKYIGALFHYDWNDYNDWRGFHVLDTESGEFEAIENKKCLFSQCDLLDLKDLEDYSIFTNKIVRLTIDSEYKQVELKEYISKIESSNPISLGIIDNTILETALVSEDETEESQTVKTKEVLDYFKEAFKDHSEKDSLLPIIDELYNEAKAKMKEIE